MLDLFRKPVKPSTSSFGVAIALSLVLNVQFAVTVARDSYANGHHQNFLMLPVYWLIWNLFPLTILAIGKLIQKQGR